MKKVERLMKTTEERWKKGEKYNDGKINTGHGRGTI